MEGFRQTNQIELLASDIPKAATHRPHLMATPAHDGVCLV